MTKGKPDDTLPQPTRAEDEGPPTSEIRRSRIPKPPPPLQLNLEMRTFPKGTMIADFYDQVEEVLVIRTGRVILETYDSKGNDVLPDFRLEVGPKQILFEELLTHEGESGYASNYRVTAKEDVEAYVIAMYDLTGDDADPVARRRLLYLVLHAMAETTAHGRRLQILHREDENGVLEMLDKAREKANELETNNIELKTKVARLEEQNRHITVSAVEETVRRELRRLIKETGEQQDELRRRARKIIDLEAAAQSANNYVQSLTEDVVRYEHLRDLLELETADPKVFLSEVHRVFLALLSTNDRQLQILGVQGLGVLSELSNRSERTSRLPPPPTKNPPQGG